MIKRMRPFLVGIAVSLAMIGVSLGAAVSLPFTDSFEGSIDSDWNEAGTGIVAVDPGEAPTGGGSDSCTISNDSIQVDVTSANNAWVQVYTKAAGYDGDPDSSDIDGLSAVFFVTTNGVLRAMNGDGSNGGSWTNVYSGISMTANKTDWLGFVVHIDYVDKTWDIYRQSSGEAGAAVLTRLAAGLGFRFDQANITSVEIATGLAASVDEIGLVQGYSAASNSLYGTVDSVTTNHVTSSWVLKTIGDIDSYDATESKLNNAAGWDLMMGMKNPDKIRLYLTSGTPTGYNIYEMQGDGTWSASGGAQAPANVTLAKGESWWIEYDSTTNNSLEFVSATLNTTDNGQSDMVGESISIPAAWTHVVYGGSTLPINSCGLGELVAGDRLFVAAPSGFFASYYVATGGTIYDFSNQAAAINLQSGSQVWIRNVEGTTRTWTSQ